MFKWIIQWQLDKATSKGGLVVQKIDSALAIKDCKGQPYNLPLENYDPKWYPFWEAWEIPKGKQVTNLKITETGGGDDVYVSKVGVTSSTGSHVISGTAEFFESAKLADTTFKVANKPPAGQLPMTKTEPQLAGGAGAIPHNFTAMWDCCTKGKKTTGATEVAPK